MPVERAASLTGQILDALGHAHRAGIVHRDLKPANLMLTDAGVVKVMDFGIARVSGTERMTSDGFMVGTPAYMAPEQVRGDDVDGRTDLYAVGVVFYRLLTGRSCRSRRRRAVAMIQSQLNDQPTPARERAQRSARLARRGADAIAGETSGRSLSERRRIPPRARFARRRSARSRRCPTT